MTTALNLEIENTFTGPLAHRRTLDALERAVASARDLDEADAAISRINGLATYKGGRHVAIHPQWNGRFADGSKRLAIVTEAA